MSDVNGISSSGIYSKPPPSVKFISPNCGSLIIIASSGSPPGSESFARRVSGAILTGSPGANVIMSCCARGTVGSIILILTLTGSLSRAPFDTM